MSEPELGKGELQSFVSACSNPLTRKLLHFAPLSPSDRDILDTLLVSEERFGHHMDIVEEGMRPRSVIVVLEGMAARYRTLSDGSRQIITFLLPGDICEAHVFLVRAMDHSIRSVTPIRIASISRENIMAVFVERPRISAALWWSSLQEAAMLRERIVSLGRRDARSRVAYLLCELLWRLQAAELASGDVFSLPLTQTEIADAVALTPTYVNSILKDFRARRLISIERRVLHVLNMTALQAEADFTDEYLNWEGDSVELSKYFDRLELDRNKNHGPPVG